MTQLDPSWKLLSSYGMVLVYVASARGCITQREISDALGITERQVATNIKDLATAGVIRIERASRCNQYIVNRDAPVRHPLLAHLALGDVLDVLLPQNAPSATEVERAVGATAMGEAP
jgi:DNA-binding transcriptional regulator LsrR (DeoR family)